MARRLSSISKLRAACRILCTLAVFFELTIAATAQNPVPQIARPLVPAAAPPLSSAFTLTVNGAGFVRNSVVLWNGSRRPTAYVSSTQLQARIFHSDLARPSTASVTVFNPGRGGGTSNVDFFQINVPHDVAFVSSNRDMFSFAQRVVAADLNGDSKLDLARTLSSDNAVGVRLGDGNGSFQTEVKYATGVNPSDVVAGDFNGDSKLDLAVLCDSGVVSLLLGNGDGTFQSRSDSPIDAGLNVFGIATGDFNGDGKLDVVVGYQDASSNNVSVLLGNGNGTFAPPVDYATGNEPGAVAIADLNHDGHLDIVAANFANFGGNTVSVLLGNGDGTFQPQVQYATSNGALSVAIADFNADGIPDLAVDAACGTARICGYPGAVSILLGKGDGTFNDHVDYPAPTFPYTVAAGDFNGDGILDLLVPDLDTSRVSIFLGKGDGTFSGFLFAGDTGGSPVGVAPGDFNGNGMLDAAIGTAGGFTMLMH